MKRTLYLSYRPQTIGELDLLDVRETLGKYALGGIVPHAFLFSGPRGTGKTSAARILAKVINCENLRKSGEPCNKCDHCVAISKGDCMDVIEIDGASNRGIDDIRALRENIALSPVSCKKKIYIIDEVHMLTLEAANAFLKTLEEPPGHVVFILATTDPQRLPETVRSRLSELVFSRATEGEIMRQLRRVIKGEKLNLEDGVMKIIAKYADGSFRDAVKILESLVDGRKKITVEMAREKLVKHGSVEALCDFLEGGDEKGALEEISKIVKNGGDVVRVVDRLIGIFREKLFEEGGSKYIFLLELLVDCREKIALSPVPQLPLEIAVVKWCGSFGEGGSGGGVFGEVPSVGEGVVPERSFEGGSVVVSGSGWDGEACLTHAAWSAVCEKVRGKNISIDTLLRSARPLSFDGKKLQIGVYYQFHKERLEDQQNRRFLEEVLSGVLGFPVSFCCALTERPRKKRKELKRRESASLTAAEDEDIISAAKEIFGS